VLQTIILPLCVAGHPSHVTVKGGTHVPWSPSFHFLKYVFTPLVRRLGGRIELDIEKWGWYPAGGGLVTAKLEPVGAFKPITITERGRLLSVRGVSAVANLPAAIAERQARQALKLLGSRGIDAEIESVSAPSPGKGTLFFLLAEFENVIVGFDSLGAIGKRAEQVADEACRDLFAYLDSCGALEPHLADQVVPFLALARGASEFTTSRITQHLLTNMWVVKQFLDVDIEVEGNEGEEGRVKINAGSRVRN
jgi:RNA 3'-terminal phosphate cyclase (ATP)